VLIAELPMSDHLSLPEPCWTALSYSVAAGDVLAGVPFVAIDHLSQVERDENAFDYRAPVRMAYGLVVRVIEDHAIVAPILTAEAASPDLAFDEMVEAGRDEREWISLPALSPAETGGDGWESALAFLFTPAAYPCGVIRPLRLRSMTDTARDVLRVRLARCFE